MNNVGKKYLLNFKEQAEGLGARIYKELGVNECFRK